MSVRLALLAGATALLTLTPALPAALTEPAWPRPVPPVVEANAPSVISGELSVVHAGSSLGAFAVRVNGTNVAVGNTRSVIGYLQGQTPRWFTLSNSVSLTANNGTLVVRATVTDPDGGLWQLQQSFQPSTTLGGIEVESDVTVTPARAVICLPLLTLLPGVGSFGTNKTQAVLAGLEYLEDEPSSSQADITTAGWQRLVPTATKLTFPLMALAAGGNYIGLVWEPSGSIAALHDSPDRLFDAGGHLMGLIFPGADPNVRADGSILPYAGQWLAAGQTLSLRATIIGGSGQTIVPALEQYVARRGLPVWPATGYNPEAYFALAAHGWLDTPIRSAALFRNAVAANFTFTPAADAACGLDWLAAHVSDPTLQVRLANTARFARAAVAPPAYNSATVGHIRFPVGALVYGDVPENVQNAMSQGLAELGLFESDGTIHYRPPASGPDLGKTSSAPDANGLTAGHVLTVLENASFSGDPALLEQGLRLLRALHKYREGVPRGAQTWEVPLHTPDILASAWLVRCYTLGYELFGDPDMLAQARYWAWTGLPFVYLTPPNRGPVGLYCTIPVYGASLFTYSWFGLPVQWCGLVYADAVRRFARHDPAGPWVALANGIAAAGLQQTHADPGLQGLLPDSFNLQTQTRNAPAINPGTLFPEALALFGQDPLYDFRVFPRHGLIVHAPGPMTDCQETSQAVRFSVVPWPQRPWYLLINGFAGGTVRVNGSEITTQAGRLILGLNSPVTVEIPAPALDALRIERAPGRGNLSVSWPASGMGLVLQETSALPGGWTNAVAAGVIQGARCMAEIVPTGPLKFYRLAPPPAGP